MDTQILSLASAGMTVQCWYIRTIYEPGRNRIVVPARRRLAESIPGLLNCYLCTYDLYGPVRNAFDADRVHYGGNGRGLGPGN